MRRVYLDHAATTPVEPEVAELMAQVLRDVPGNPSSIYAEGRKARAAVDRARDEVAAAIGADAGEIVFTSGGTEADNLALRGVLAARRGEADGLVTTAIEHHAVLDTAHDLAREGRARVTVTSVDALGRVDPAAIDAAIDERTALVSVMHGNNEVGTLQPIEAIGAICRERGVAFHSDAVQTVGALAIDVRVLPVDLLSVNAHKFYGPKGVGALYVRKGTRRAALRMATARRATESARQAALRDRLVSGIRARIPHATLTGHPTERLPNNASFCFDGTQGEALIVSLDLEGFAASSGSACTSGNTEPSHVLLAMGLDRELAQGSLRLTVGRDTTEADVDALLDALPPIVARLRAASGVPVPA